MQCKLSQTCMHAFIYVVNAKEQPKNENKKFSKISLNDNCKRDRSTDTDTRESEQGRQSESGAGSNDDCENTH